MIGVWETIPAHGAFSRIGYIYLSTRHLFVKNPNIALTIKQENLKTRVFRKMGLRLGIEGKVILK